MENQRVSTADKPITLNTLGMEIMLPEGATISPYEIKNQKKQSKSAKQRQKYSHFSYYKLKDSTIVKILFITSETYIEISRFPFIQSSDVTKVRDFKQLNDSGAIRLTTADSLLIGIQNKDTTIVRKLEICKVSQTDAEVDTVQDIFQSIPFLNKDRYNHVVSSLKQIKMASLRVIIQQGQEKAQILDYDYFFAQREFAKRHSQPVQEKPILNQNKEESNVDNKKESKKPNHPEKKETKTNVSKQTQTKS